jgi:hypothetical protein
MQLALDPIIHKSPVAKEKRGPQIRVTRLGEVSLIERFFYTEQVFYYRSGPHFGDTFSAVKVLTKKMFGLYFGRSFSQTHLVTLPPIASLHFIYDFIV